MVILALLAAGSTSLAVPRVAVLTEDRDLEALLTASLKNCQILSRSLLPQAEAEAALNGQPLQLEGADLVLVVERSGSETNTRLVSAVSGATISSWMAPTMPADQLVRWIVLRAEPFLRGPPRTDVPRASVLGLRFETDSPAHRAAERLANLMISAKLHSSGAVVLERWRLGDLVFEKSLRADDGPFWADADLLDGSIKQEEGNFVAQVRIRRAGVNERRTTVKGSTLGELAQKVSEFALERPPSRKEGPTLEPQAFLAESRWMLANGLPREAWQAAEAALALGATGTEPEMLRVKAAAMTAYPDDLRVTTGAYNLTAFPVSELPLRMAAATEANSLAADYLEKHSPAPAPSGWSLENPPTLAIQTLNTGFRVLRTAEDSGWSAENLTATHALVAALQRNIELLKTAPLRHMTSPFFSSLTQYAGYWNNTSAEAIAFYRDVLRTDFLPSIPSWPKTVRGLLVDENRPRPPFLLGALPKNGFPSTPGARLLPAPGSVASREAWRVFLDEMSRSPELLVQADSLALRWQSTVDLPARHALTAQIVNLLAKNKTLLSGPFGAALLRELRGPLQEVNASDDLEASQEKLVAIFQDFLDSPEPLPRDLLSAISIPFYNDKPGKREGQAKALLATIAARGKRTGQVEADTAILSDARSRLLREFPQLRSEEISARDIVVKTFWDAAEHTPEALRGHISFNPEAAIWHKGALWVLDSSGGRLWRIQPTSGESEIISPSNSSDTSHESDLVVWGDRLVITTKTGVKVLDSDLSTWRNVDLPKAKYAIGVSGPTLWASSGHRYRADASEDHTGTMLYRVTPELSATLIGSSRRRPAENPLDEKLSGEPFVILPADHDGAILGTYGESWTFLDTTTARPPERFIERFAGSVQTASFPGIIVQCLFRGGDRNRFTRVELFTSHGNELLLSHPTLGTTGKPRFAFPPGLDEFPAREFTVTWDGTTLTVLAWTWEGSPWGISKALLFRISDDGVQSAPLRFAWSADNTKKLAKSHRDSRVFQYPWPDPKSLIPTDTGLVITGRAMPGFWFVPYTELPQRGK